MQACNLISILELDAIRWLERYSFLHKVIAYQQIGLGQAVKDANFFISKENLAHEFFIYLNEGCGWSQLHICTGEMSCDNRNFYRI